MINFVFILKLDLRIWYHIMRGKYRKPPLSFRGSGMMAWNLAMLAWSHAMLHTMIPPPKKNENNQINIENPPKLPPPNKSEFLDMPFQNHWHDFLDILFRNYHGFPGFSRFFRVFPCFFHVFSGFFKSRNRFLYKN